MIDTVNASDKDKARFLRVFAFIGSITSFLMAITSYQDGYHALSYLLIIGGFVFASPFVIKNRDETIAVLMLYALYSMMCFLIVSGGSNGTGPLWLFIVSPVTFFIRGLRRGAFDSYSACHYYFSAFLLYRSIWLLQLSESLFSYTGHAVFLDFMYFGRLLRILPQQIQFAVNGTA
ncbi:hypothetical protein [Pseudoalteromonas gelatinilytica]